MRILVVTPQMATGGAERVVAMLCRGLAGRRHNVVLASSGGRLVDDLPPSVLFHRVSWLRGRSPVPLARAAGDLSRIIRADRYDLINCHSFISTVVAAAAIRRARCRLPVVSTLHLPERPWAFRVAGKTLPALSDRVVSVSEANRRRLIEAGMPSDLVSVIRNAVDIREFDANTPRPPTNGTLIVGVIARLIERKRHRDLLDAAARLGREGLRLRLRFIGDGPLRDKLESQAATLGLRDSVEFLGDRNDIAELLRSLDVMVLPSTYEGLPVALIEAMAAGVPVVASAVAGNAEVIEDGRNGLLTAPRDPALLANALKRLALDDELRLRLAQHARVDARARFRVDRMVDDYERVFSEVISARIEISQAGGG